MTNDPLSSDVRASLQAIGVDDALVRLVGDVADRRVVDAEGGDRYVALRPAHDAMIACYINPRFAAVRLDADRAVAVSRERQWQLATKNGTAGIVHVPSAALDDPDARAHVVELVLEALEWSARGPGRRAEADRHGGAEVRDEARCKEPACNMVLLGGVCAIHD